MTVSGNVSVPSVNFQQITLSVSGTSALNYATDFATALNNANTAGMLQISDLDTPLPEPGSASGTVTEYVVSSTGETGTLAYGGTYLLDVAAGNSTVTVSGAGDTVLGAGGGMTYLDQGGNNNVLFVSGNNSYVGPRSQGLTPASDTITAGSGNDTISTGPDDATVFSGTGRALITLRDSGTPTSNNGTSVANDVVVLNDGINTVNAYGVNDQINVAAPGQVITGGTSAGDTDLVLIAAAANGAAGHDSINAGAGNMTVFDSAGGDTIDGGTGLLTFEPGPALPGTTLSDTVGAQLGMVDIFGSAGDAITLTSTQIIGQPDVFVAGTGSETLDASHFGGTVDIFGNDSGSAVIATGAGRTVYVGGQDTLGTTLNALIDAGSGGVSIFGANGDSTTINSPADSAGILYVAGTNTVTGVDSETIQASGANGPITVFGGQGGSLAIAGGSGSLLFVGGSSYAEAPSATIAAGTGGATMFGNDGDVLTLTSNVQNTSVFLAGAGNETLDGSAFGGNLVAYGYNPADPIAGGNVNESVIGGSGANYFYTGAGYETFVAGSGYNAFQIDKTTDGLGGTITVYNYTTGEQIGFSGFTAADEKTAIASAKASTNGVVGTQITLSDQTTVLFVDASVSDLTFKT